MHLSSMGTPGNAEAKKNNFILGELRDEINEEEGEEKGRSCTSRTPRSLWRLTTTRTSSTRTLRTLSIIPCWEG
jgi:hypothetical protein